MSVVWVKKINQLDKSLTAMLSEECEFSSLDLLYLWTSIQPCMKMQKIQSK